VNAEQDTISRLQLNDAPAGSQIFCAQSVYVRDHQTSQIRRIAGPGDNAPRGGMFGAVYGQKINNSGQIAFLGWVPAKPPGTSRRLRMAGDGDGAGHRWIAA
jgi:hypothetical protein